MSRPVNPAQPPLCLGPATRADAPAILALQHQAYQSEARLYQDWTLPPLTQTLAELEAEFDAFTVLKAEQDGRLVGSVRARREGDVWAIGRLVVAPGQQGRGIGTRLLGAIEALAGDARRCVLFTGSRSVANLRLYQRLGYSVTHTVAVNARLALTYLEKIRA